MKGLHREVHMMLQYMCAFVNITELLTCTGFSNANQTWLPVNLNYRTLNVKSQQEEKWSHIKVYKLLIEARKTEAIMHGGLDIHILEDSVLVYTRYGTTIGANQKTCKLGVKYTMDCHMTNTAKSYIARD
jgi:hypothetical protein